MPVEWSAVHDINCGHYAPVHHATMVPKFGRLLDLNNWRGLVALFRALRVYHRGDRTRAIFLMEKAIQAPGLQCADYMMFYANLLVLDSKKPLDEVIDIYKKVAAREYVGLRGDHRYPVALAHYILAQLYRRPDVVARWLDAYALKPKKGFAALYLPLPDDPLMRPSSTPPAEGALRSF